MSRKEVILIVCGIAALVLVGIAYTVLKRYLHYKKYKKRHAPYKYVHGYPISQEIYDEINSLHRKQRGIFKRHPVKSEGSTPRGAKFPAPERMKKDNREQFEIQQCPCIWGSRETCLNCSRREKNELAKNVNNTKGL